VTVFDGEMTVDVDVDSMLFGRKKNLSLRTWKSLVKTKRSKRKDGWRSYESS